MAEAQAPRLTGRTAWARSLAAPVREFLSTETGSAMVLLGATVVALLWANSPWRDSYESVWTTKLSIVVGSSAISADFRTWRCGSPCSSPACIRRSPASSNGSLPWRDGWA